MFPVYGVTHVPGCSRDARRQLRPGFVWRRHLRRLGLRARSTPTPATTMNGRRGCGRRHLLPARHLLGNRLRRTTGTAGTPLPACFATATTATVLGFALADGDASQQRLDRGADLALHRVTDHRHEASLS